MTGLSIMVTSSIDLSLASSYRLHLNSLISLAFQKERSLRSSSTQPEQGVIFWGAHLLLPIHHTTAINNDHEQGSLGFAAIALAVLDELSSDFLAFVLQLARQDPS